MNHQHFMRPFLVRALSWAFAENKRRQQQQQQQDVVQHVQVQAVDGGSGGEATATANL